MENATKFRFSLSGEIQKEGHRNGIKNENIKSKANILDKIKNLIADI